MTAPATHTLPKTARIRLALTGRIVGGIVAERHAGGEVTILWGGLRRRGKAISLEKMLMIEAGEESR